MSTTPMKWCEKSSALAKQLHLANVACDETEENSQEALSAIGRAVAEHVAHKGKIPTFHSIRAKLNSMEVYKAKAAPTPKTGGGKVISKAELKTDIARKLGIDGLDTLVNANHAELTEVSKATATLIGQTVKHSTKETLYAAIEALENAEQDAILAGCSVSTLAEIEQATAELMANESE